MKIFSPIGAANNAIDRSSKPAERSKLTNFFAQVLPSIQRQSPRVNAFKTRAMTEPSNHDAIDLSKVARASSLTSRLQHVGSTPTKLSKKPQSNSIKLWHSVQSEGKNWFKGTAQFSWRNSSLKSVSVDSIMCTSKKFHASDLILNAVQKAISSKQKTTAAAGRQSPIPTQLPQTIQFKRAANEKTIDSLRDTCKSLGVTPSFTNTDPSWKRTVTKDNNADSFKAMMNSPLGKIAQKMIESVDHAHGSKHEVASITLVHDKDKADPVQDALTKLTFNIVKIDSKNI